MRCGHLTLKISLSLFIYQTIQFKSTITGFWVVLGYLSVVGGQAAAQPGLDARG